MRRALFNCKAWNTFIYSLPEPVKALCRGVPGTKDVLSRTEFTLINCIETTKYCQYKAKNSVNVICITESTSCTLSQCGELLKSSLSFSFNNRDVINSCKKTYWGGFIKGKQTVHFGNAVAHIFLQSLVMMVKLCLFPSSNHMQANILFLLIGCFFQSESSPHSISSGGK
ncbi:unnamed protein product [Staurois parvus]|uniref:Uncharacterized protein n=1 Tax=Staurois parvus TaxID=386267 RepID=A0ABN9HJW9_9NEOB|nr:unnamed protein product [Staurois parvus]